MISVPQHLAHIRPRIRTAADYLAWVTRQIVARNDGTAMHDSLTPIPARIDWGRWVIDCPCGTVVMADASWPFAPCAGCGAVHKAIVYPENRDAIEAAINLRPQKSQFFFPVYNAERQRGPETLETLQRENVENGLVAPS